MNIKVIMITVIIVVLCVLISAGVYYAFSHLYREAQMSVSGWVLSGSIFAGVLLSIVVTYALMRVIADAKVIDPFKLRATARYGTRIGTYLFGIIAFPIGLFLGVVFGGNFGGSIGAALWGDVGIIIGVSFGIFSIVTIVCCIIAILGFFIGGFTEKLLT